eukprot:scaffold52309_cov60-Phaeocystis_antarctica.AAC.3
MPHSPTAASRQLQPGPFVPLGSPPLAVFASTAEVRRLLEQLRPHTERCARHVEIAYRWGGWW